MFVDVKFVSSFFEEAGLMSTVKIVPHGARCADFAATSESSTRFEIHFSAFTGCMECHEYSVNSSPGQ